MTKPIASVAAAMSLMLGASSATPAFAGAKEHKCTGAGHSHSRPAATGLKSRVVESVPRVERPRIDIRIVSFGP